MEDLALGQVNSQCCQHKFLEKKKSLDLEATISRISTAPFAKPKGAVT